MSDTSTVVLACAVMYGTTISRQILNKEPVTYWRPLIAALGVGFVLSLIQAGAPKLAQSLAWLLIVSAVLVNGQPLLKRASQIGK